MYNIVKDRPSAALVMVEGADHGFPGMEDLLADEVLRWLGGLPVSETLAPQAG
jgi:hypothetical protein